jgi:hypothetical protein
MTVMRIAEKEEDLARQKLNDMQDTYDNCIKEGRKKSIVVDGDSLTVLLKFDDMKKQFVAMS